MRLLRDGIGAIVPDCNSRTELRSQFRYLHPLRIPAEKAASSGRTREFRREISERTKAGPRDPRPGAVAFLVNSHETDTAVDAVDLTPLTIAPIDTPLGTEADAWFMALDGRVVSVGGDTGVLRVEGIHAQGSVLWIQISLFDDAVPGVVIQVEACHSQHDVFEALRTYELTGVPLEIIKV
jgi:hypothetical protein